MKQYNPFFPIAKFKKLSKVREYNIIEESKIRHAILKIMRVTDS